jgi:hypothetical protein
MTAIDPSGFQISAIIVAGGRRYPLWLVPNGTESGLPDTFENGLPILESLDIETGLALNSKVTATLAAPFDLGLRILDSDLLRVGNVLEVQVGYARIGRFTPWISSMMTMPSVKISPDEGLSVTINGEGGAFAALRNSGSREYREKTYAQIIREICEGDNYNLIVTLPEQNGSEDPLYRTRERVSMANQSDWFFVQWITRSSNCDCWIAPSTDESGRQELIVARRSRTMGAAPRFTFRMRGLSDFETVFPILDWDSNAEGVWLPGSAVSIRTMSVNPDDLTVTELSTSSEESSVPSTGASVPSDGGARVEDVSVRLTPARTEDTAGAHLYVPDRDPRGTADVLAAHQTESALRGGVQADMSTIGIPDFFPGEILEVDGLGVFDALYLAEKVTHRVQPGEWTMQVHLLNNATTNSFLVETLSGFAAAVNEETAPASTGDATGGGTEVSPEPGDS